MRLTTFVFALAGALMLTGCSSLVSLNPFVTDKEATFDPNLPGVWIDKEDNSTYTVRQSGDVYAITYIEKDNSVQKFEGRVFKLGDATLLDLVPKNDAPFHIPVHTLMRIWTTETTLKMSMLQSKWLKEQAEKSLITQPVDDRTLITTPTAGLQNFLAFAATDPKAYEETGVLTRVR